jgi:hypothetical protein
MSERLPGLRRPLARRVGHGSMPRSEDIRSAPTPEPRGRRAAGDAWEAVVRQELLKARRRRPARFAGETGVDQVLPVLREARGDEPPQERA